MKKAVINGSIYVPFEIYETDLEDHYNKRFLKELALENVERYLKNAERLIRDCNIYSSGLKIDFIANYSEPVICKGDKKSDSNT